jgi:NADH:ubiquinone reductase (H+-translocating)
VVAARNASLFGKNASPSCYNGIVKNSTNQPNRPRVVVVGAGFAGLRVARGLRGAPVDVTVLDKHNYHTFIPLLYQVATAGLEPEAIAHPVRRIVTAPNIRFRLASVTGVDLEQRRVITDAGDFHYDYLVLAAGSITSFFGLESVARHAATLRELDDAETVRDRVLASFEAAAAEKDRARRQALMTTVIVGGGPTGVELAGALAELRRHVLPRDFPELHIGHARILLLEASNHVLETMPERMQRKALEKLREMGVDVQLNARVTDADERGVTLADGVRIDAGAVVWVAGLRASPLAQALDAPLGAGGRVVVSPSLSLPNHPEVYIIGDMAHAGGRDSPPHPMLAPVAIQQGDLVAENILRQTRAQKPRAFKYKDPGTMVTIGRASAVARVYGVPVSGFIAWLLWLTVHIVWLIGFRNRALVLVNWAWNYFTYERGVRLIRRRR